MNDADPSCQTCGGTGTLIQGNELTSNAVPCWCVQEKRAKELFDKPVEVTELDRAIVYVRGKIPMTAGYVSISRDELQALLDTLERAKNE